MTVAYTSPAGLTSLVVILAPTPHVDSLHSISPSPALDGLAPLAQTCTRRHVMDMLKFAKWRTTIYYYIHCTATPHSWPVYHAPLSNHYGPN